MILPKTLLARTGVTVAVAILSFLLFSSIVVGYYILLPVAKRSAEDLAALMVFSAQTWVELPPYTREDFERELLASHGLMLQTATQPLTDSAVRSPYMLFIESALAQRTEHNIKVLSDPQNEDWLLVDIPIADKTLRLGFEHQRIGPRPPVAVLLLILGGIVVTLTTTLLLVRKLTKPLARLSSATREFARGAHAEPLPVSGPEELAELTRHFNQMTGKIEHLLANRTIVLAGISHDLRTPIARIQLALELLNNQAEPQLIQGIHKDLGEMNQLIGKTLEFARGLDEKTHKDETVDINLLISELVDSTDDPLIQWQSGTDCVQVLNRLALHRVLSNLLENARRYGDKKPVSILCECNVSDLVIRILDQGPGIPEHELNNVFQPFHRLENSRNQTTGGSGLGLAIAQQLCQVNNWQISLHANPVGGTEARLCIRTIDRPAKASTSRI